MEQHSEGGDAEGRDLVRHEEPGFGYAVTVPADLAALMNTVDPLARLLRGVHDKDPDEESRLTGSWPVGFADPRVVGDIGGSHLEPLRLLEFDVLQRPDPLGPGDLAALQQTVVAALPREIESLRLPGFEFLGAREARLGRLDALAFEYEWDGPGAAGPGAPGPGGGDGGDEPRGTPERDRGLVVWAPSPTTVYHVYYHCPASVWDRWWPELMQILASFELIPPRPQPAPGA
ncbi:MAG TPA: hypothetical protein VMH50_08240 [Thermoleophilia bacterium]|nr:hypothetical protein [Thermoleophilia bacterium]